MAITYQGAVYSGLSGDTKPTTNLTTGNLFVETDTDKVFMWNGSAWDIAIGDGTITAAKIATNAVTSTELADNAVDTAAIADNAVTLAKIADGTQGDILYYAASGAPTLLGAGTSGQFLKTQGTCANPVWAAAGGISNVVEDTTPQLGGSLDAQNNTILNIGAAGNDIDSGGYNAVDGTAAAPSYSFTCDPDIGMYRICTNILGLATAGVEHIRIDANGKVIVNAQSASNPTPAVAGPFSVKADCTHTGLTMFACGCDVDVGAKFQVYERGSGGASGSHSYVSGCAVPIVNSGGTGGRGGIAFVHGEQDGDTNTFTDMVIIPVTGGFSNCNYNATACTACVGSGNVIFRLNVRGSPAARTYSLGASNTLYLAMASGNYNIVTNMLGLSGLAS